MAPGGKKPQKILKLGDYEVWVAISEKRTEVYQVTEKGNTISCFIASEEGKGFSVHWRNKQSDRSRTSMCCDVYVDGKCVEEALFLSEITEERYTDRCKTSETTERKLQFAKLSRTEEANNSCTDQRRLVGLGSIRVEMLPIKVKKCGNRRKRRESPSRINVKHIGEPVHETERKDVSHCAALGREEALEDNEQHYGDMYEHRYLDLPKLNFVFNFAPLSMADPTLTQHVGADWVFFDRVDWLQAKRVVPEPSDPRDAHRREKRERPSEELEDQEAQEKPDPDEAYLANLQDILNYRRMKQEIEKRKKAKEEPIDVPAHLLVQGAVIDLTMSDSE